MNRLRYLISDSTACIRMFILTTVLAILPAAALAADTNVHAEYPGYDIVVGKDVTFKWYDTVTRVQRSFELATSESVVSANSSQQEVWWPNFPFGTGHWNVAIYNCTNQNCWIGETSKQNFYHYNNIPNTKNYRPEPFEYKRGARNLAQTRDLTIFYELTKDYRIDINSYFTDFDSLPDTIAGGVYNRTAQQHEELKAHIQGMDNIESDFIYLDDGVLTLKKGYRWDGTSNPFVWEENPSDLRSSGIHDAFYDLMRMDLITPNTGVVPEWNESGYMNRMVADTMHYFIAVEDKDKAEDEAWSDWRTLRKLGQGKTHKDKLLRAFKYHVSELTAWVAEDGGIDLHWLPANRSDDDPKDYHDNPHRYDIYRTASNASEWLKIGSIPFNTNDMPNHTDSTVYFHDSSVTKGEIYYYWIRANDPDSDGDGWTDQEENDYGGGYNNSPGLHPKYFEKHYDESVVEAVVPETGPGNALQLNGIDQFVISTTEPGTSTGASWTFEAWVYPETGDGLSTILALSDVDPGNAGQFTPLMYDDVNNLFCFSDGVTVACNDNGPIVPGFWYHLAVTINGRDGMLYVDGFPEAAFSVSKWPEATPTFGIGASFDNEKIWDEEGGEYSAGAWVYDITTSNHYKGKIDELRVWNVALTQSEIQANMFAPLRGDYPELVALWHFDEPDRTHTAHDATINGRDGEVYECTTPNGSCFVTSNAMNIPPVALCADVTISTEPGTCQADASVDNGSYDLDGNSITLLQEPSGPYGAGETDVTLTVTGEWGNAASCTATVTVVDEVSPVALARDNTVELDAAGKASITSAQVDAGSSDACGIESISVSPSSFTCADVGPNAVTLTVTDINGNVSTADAIVKVEDNAAPVALTQDITVQLDASGNASITAAQVDAGSSDACGIESISVSRTSFTCADVGPNVVTLTVTDINGKVSTADAIVTVQDNAAPVALAQDITVELDADGNASITAAQVDAGSSDACGIASISVSPTSFTCSDVGPNTVTLTVTDINGNVGTADATVTVEDNIPPEISNVSASPEVLWPPNHKMVTVEIIDASISDNCGDIDLGNCRIVSVTSNEPINGSGDGNTDPDFEITGDLTADLRAEKSGSGNGRIYIMTLECTDTNENTSTATVDISVPHDQGKKKGK